MKKLLYDVLDICGVFFIFFVVPMAAWAWALRGTLRLMLSSLFLLGLVVGAANTQIVEPEQPPAKKKFKAIAPASVKAWDHIVIDASSAPGDVWFFYDETMFPKTRATTVGKVLILSTNINGKHLINVASLDDKTKELISVVVTGGVDAKPPDPDPDPPPSDDIVKLAAMVAKLAQVTEERFKEVITMIAQDRQRLTAIEEKLKIVPPPPSTTVAHVTFVFSPHDANAIAINNNPELRLLLKNAGIKVHVVYPGTLVAQGPAFKKAVEDAGGVPTVIMQDATGAVVATCPMNSVAQVTLAIKKEL